MDNTIDTLQIEIESSTTGGQRSITKLKNSLEKLAEMSENVAKISSEGVSKLKAMADGVEALGNAGNNPGLSKAISELRKLSKLDFSGIATGSDKIKEIADAVDGQLSSQANATPAAATTPASGETVDILPGSEVAQKQKSILDFFASIGAKGKSTASVLKSVFSSAMSGIGKAVKGTASAFGSFFGAAVKGAGKIAKLMVGSVMENVKKVTGKVQQFTKSLARIAMYRVVRMLLTQIANAFKEGTNNCYQYSKAIGGTLANSMDSMATSMLYFKNSIGAMVAPLLNALAPAIEYVIDKVVALINVLNQLFAKLTGASTWTKAIKTQTEYAESAGGAADAAKSLTAGFDELNVLSDSGSGGGGASTPDYSSMFEEVQLDNDFASWVDQIKEAIGNGDWAGVGQILGDKVNSIVDSIDFAGIGTKLGSGIQSAFELIYSALDTINFDNIGAGIATLLNNAFEQIDFSLVGKTFAKKWTILVGLLYGFVTTFDWAQFGLAVSDFINGWFEEVDLTKAVQTAQTLILGLFTSLQQAVQNIEWYKIGTEIMDAIESIDWGSLLGELGKTLSDAVIGLLDLLLGVVGETDWGKVLQDIMAGLGEMLANIDWGQILSKIGALIVELVVQIPSLIVGALGGISDLLGGLFEGFGLDSIAGFFYGIGDAMRDAGTWLKENLVDPVVNWVKDLFGIHSPSTVFADMGVNIIDGLWQGIKDTWHTITDFFSEKLDGIKKVCSDAWNSIKSTASTVWGNIKTSLSTTWGNIKESASTTWNNMKTSMSTTWENVKSNT